ncbi:LIC_10190 family membrane protein [Chryseobacterium sp. MIQD13]|uniref:LIC_10190 family membrane protein n=1 Tax=Chryseobacterium sp. MIQD13 TaxID=3422310 RepID=UPI003D29B51B
MILLLLSSVLILTVLAGWGEVMEKFPGILSEGVSGSMLTGILGLSIIWTVLAFFIPVNIYVEIPFIMAGIFFFFQKKLYQKINKFSKKDTILIICISLIILYSSSFYPYILDHFGYYVPTIKWLTEYGLVKGISNLDLTLGQMSVWHIFQAGFSGFSDPFLRINAVVLVIYTLYIFERKNWIQLCFIPVLLLFSQSPSPDLPVITLSLIILNEIITGNKNISLLFSYAVFIFSIKPTMIWLPLLVFFSSIFIFKPNYKNWILGAGILLLFFIKNIWTFGYPVFPVSVGDFGLSWRPNPEVLKISSQYAIQKTYDMQYTYDEIQKFSSFDTVRNWFTLEGIKSKINILFIISLILFSVFAFVKKKKIITLICISILIKSILVLAFSAQYRFFIDVFFVIFFILFTHLSKRNSLVLFFISSLLVAGILSFPNFIQKYIPSFRPGNFMTGLKKEQLYQPSTYHYNKFETFRTGNLKFNVSKDYPFNFNTPVPAISASYIFDDIKAGIFPQYIDEKNIRKGFIWKKLSPQEKTEADNVINNIKNTDK